MSTVSTFGGVWCPAGAAPMLGVGHAKTSHPQITLSFWPRWSLGHTRAPSLSIFSKDITTIKRKICTPKFDVFSFVLRTPCTPSLAPLIPKMRKIIVYKTAYVTWCCYSLVVVNLGFPCLIIRFLCVRRKILGSTKMRRTGCGVYSLVMVIV